MATSTRVTRSKGESEGLSLPMRSRPTRRDATLGRNGGTALSTSGREHQQQMPTQTPHLTQSPQAAPEERTATAPMLPPGPHRPLTPRMPLPASPTSSLHSSAPLFQEDGYSSTSEEESEVTFTHGRSNGTFSNQHAKRTTSTPTPSNYTTQDDPDASPSSSFKPQDENDEFLGTNNFFVPDGSNRRIHQIHNKVFHAGYLENGNNAYLLELPALENMLNTRKFLMDEMSGQFCAVYGNSYQRMSTKPMLQQAWATGELIDELAATRQAFRYTGLAGSTPPLTTENQPTASTSQQPDDLLPRQPALKTVQYQPPTFRLTRPTTRLTKNERIQVHHNYISAVSSLEHKKDLINRLKRSDTCNIPAYEAEMSHHMTLHEDVLERILNILKQDDYYRNLEDLPVIDELTAYDDIKLFPELYDMSMIIERVTTEADLIERQFRRPGMYPQHTAFSQPTPNLPKTNPQPTSSDNSRNSSPQSSLPCGQRTSAASTSSSDVQSSQTAPQMFTTSHQPQFPTKTQHTSPSPHKQHTPSKTNIDQSSQSSIAGEGQQRVPKSADGTQVKCSKQQPRQPDERLCFHCNLPGHLKRNCPKIPYCSKCRTKGHAQDRCINRPQKTRHTHPAGEPRDQQTEALVNEHHGRIYREELLLNCGTSVSKTIHTLPQGVTNQIIKDAVLRNHSNLRTVSQRSNAYQQLRQKPDEALQSYNTRYASFFHLAYPELDLDNPLSRMHCIHYASSLYRKLGDEMTGRFNQDLPENLQMAFEKAVNFEPRIIMKQSINSRKIHKINHIDIG